MAEVLNHDIVGIHNRTNRIIQEVMLCQSANWSQTHPDDERRCREYVQDLRDRMQIARDAPILDLPETSPRVYPLAANPEIPVIENEDLKDVLRLFEVFRDELSNSQSARMSAQMMNVEHDRIVRILDKIDQHLSFLHGEDLPESSPNAPITGAGKAGI